MLKHTPGNKYIPEANDKSGFIQTKAIQLMALDLKKNLRKHMSSGSFNALLLPSELIFYVSCHAIFFCLILKLRKNENYYIFIITKWGTAINTNDHNLVFLFCI